MAAVAIHPSPGTEGVTIKAVQKNSLASLAGIINPEPKSTPLSKERILAMNNKPVNNLQDYYSIVDGLQADQILTIKTTKQTYKIKIEPEIEIKELNETETIIEEVEKEVNETIEGETVLINKTINSTKTVPKTEEKIIGLKPLGISVGEAPTSNIRQGLDLQGGTRVLLKPAEEVDLIQQTMAQISKKFKGIEICTIYPEDQHLQFFKKIRTGMLKFLLGHREGLTIIGPASVVKEIKRDPNNIQLFIMNDKKRRK